MSTETPVVLVAVDLSESSEALVDFAAQLAKLVHARVDLIHVVDLDGIEPDWNQQLGDQPFSEPFRAHLRARLEEASAQLEAQRKRCAEQGVESESVLLEGTAWESLLEQSFRSEADYIVLGPHTPRASALEKIRDKVLGTTADRLVRHAPVPVWLIPPGSIERHKDPFASWAVAVDFSEASLEAARLAGKLSARTGKKLSLLHVIPSGYEVHEEPRSWQGALHEGVIQQAKKELERIARDFPEQEVGAELRPSHQSLHRELLQAAEDVGASALVLGSHGKSGFGQLVLGSTVERSLRSANLPVLVVRRRADFTG